MTGPQPMMIVWTGLLLLVPVISFLVAVLPMFDNLSETNRKIGFWRVSSFLIGSPAVVLLLTALRTLYGTGCSDPGIIPRHDPKRCFPGEGPQPETIDQIVNGVRVQLKWCRTCGIYRPPRSKHCVYCNNCVMRFDHHCPWVSNCVGIRNYQSFVCFVFSTFCLTLYVFAAVLLIAVHLSRRRSGGSADRLLLYLLATEPTIVVLVACTGCLLCPLGNLVAFHCYLIGTNA